MHVNKFVAPLLAIALFVGTVAVAQATGYWIVSGKQMVDVENLSSSSDLRGWMTLQQVSDGLGIEQAEMYTLLGIPADIPAGTALKEMETLLPGFDMTGVRAALADYLGEASSVVAGEAANTEPVTTLPPTLQPTPQPSPTPQAPPTETASTLSTPVEHTPQADGIGDGTGPTPVAEGELLTGVDVKGKHTLQEIADQAQVPLAELLAALNLPADSEPSAAVRDLVEQGQIADVDAVRAAVTALQAGQ